MKDFCLKSVLELVEGSVVTWYGLRREMQVQIRL